MDAKLPTSGAESAIFWKSQISNMATNAVAHCIPRTSADMVLTMQDKLVLFLQWQMIWITWAASVLRKYSKHKQIFVLPKINLA